MAGIYLHIPFCKTPCSYCDFYKTFDVNTIDSFIEAIKLELWLQRDYLENEIIDTIYFGGGTPSVLHIQHFQELYRVINSLFSISNNAEITIEANPDDLNLLYLSELKKIGFNRISIGIQSINDDVLRFMKRRHNAVQAKNAVFFAKEAGFENISIDLIYGIPVMDTIDWKNDLRMVLEWNVQHISAYHLTYHKGTHLWTELKKGNLTELEESESVKQFEILINETKEKGFIQYEISNFSLEGFFSRHNSSYWKQKKYLGVGPSAHSYNNVSRQWNVANLNKYLMGLKKGQLSFESEVLTMENRFNDYIITSLRTIWGIDLNYIENTFGSKFTDHIKKRAQKYIENEQIEVRGLILQLSSSSLFVSDAILTDLLFES